MKKAISRATRSVYAAPGISYFPWLMMLPFSVLGTGAFVPEGGEWQAEWFLVGLIAHLVLLPIIFVSNLVARAFDFKFGSILIFAFFLMGATRGLTVSYSAELFMLVEDANYAWRIGSGMFVTATWYAVGNAAVFEIRDYSNSLAKLRGELGKQSEYLERSQQELADSREEVLQETLKLVDLGLIQVETRGKDKTQLQQISEQLHKLVDEGLAPLIQKLQNAPSKPEFVIAPYQKVSGWKIARTAFINRPFHIVVAILLQMISAITSKIWGFGFFIAMIDLAMISLAIVLSYSAGFWILKKLNNNSLRLASNLLFLMIPAIVSGLSPTILFPDSAFEPLVFLSLFNNVFAAGFLSAIGFAAKYEAEKVIGQLSLAIEQTSLARSRAEQLRLVEKKRLSRILHGSVQSKIRSLALQIERTGTAPERDKLDEFRTSIIEEITNPSQINLMEFLLELKELWGASAEIQYSLDDEIPGIIDNDGQVAVIEIVREVVSNAMKHSASTEMKITIGRYHGVSDRLGVIAITAAFDGIPIATTTPGNGLRTIGELSTHFSYGTDNNSNYFSAEVPVSAQFSVATTGT